MKTAKQCLSSMAKAFRSIPSMMAIGLITFYRGVISPLTPSSCRFHPTCSEYGLEAIKRFGFLKGAMLTAKRIIRCRPGGPYGYDPVPEKAPSKQVEAKVLLEGETAKCGK